MKRKTCQMSVNLYLGQPKDKIHFKEKSNMYERSKIQYKQNFFLKKKNLLSQHNTEMIKY